jgi:hypothetical protein
MPPPPHRLSGTSFTARHGSAGSSGEALEFGKSDALLCGRSCLLFCNASLVNEALPCGVSSLDHWLDLNA